MKLFIFFAFGFTFCQSPKVSTKQIINCGNDSLYVYVDSANYKPEENIVTLHLLYRKSDKVYRIHSRESQDGNMEMEYLYSYSNSKNHFECVEITDLATGINWLVLRDINSDSFFLTEPFNFSATGDTLIKESVDFNNLKGQIKMGDAKGDIYSISLSKLTPALIDLKRN